MELERFDGPIWPSLVEGRMFVQRGRIRRGSLFQDSEVFMSFCVPFEVRVAQDDITMISFYVHVLLIILFRIKSEPMNERTDGRASQRPK